MAATDYFCSIYSPVTWHGRWVLTKTINEQDRRFIIKGIWLLCFCSSSRIHDSICLFSLIELCFICINTLILLLAATTPLTKHLNVAIIDSNPALGNKPCINREDLPDPRVSTVTPATISSFKGIMLYLHNSFCSYIFFQSYYDVVVLPVFLDHFSVAPLIWVCVP